MKQPSENQSPHLVYIPILVTNAKLLAGTYTTSDIGANVNLSKLNLSQVNYTAINHTEILRCGPGYEQIICHDGQPKWGNMLRDDERYIGSHNKTVFVVSKEALLDFLEIMQDIN